MDATIKFLCFVLKMSQKFCWIVIKVFYTKTIKNIKNVPWYVCIFLSGLKNSVNEIISLYNEYKKYKTHEKKNDGQKVNAERKKIKIDKKEKCDGQLNNNNQIKTRHLNQINEVKKLNENDKIKIKNETKETEVIVTKQSVIETYESFDEVFKRMELPIEGQKYKFK